VPVPGKDEEKKGDTIGSFETTLWVLKWLKGKALVYFHK
jgi:hypothetical protein